MNEELKAAVKRANKAAKPRKPAVISEDRMDEILMEQNAYSADAFIYA